MKSHGYTLWLMPKAEAYNRFAQLIKKLATQYLGPVFEPHITLLGDIDLSEAEMIRGSKQLVKGQKSFPLALKQIDYEDYFFRTLFVRAELTEALQVLHNRAKEIFKIGGISAYMPHLSILYGNYPEAVKKEIIKEIGLDQNALWEVNSVVLMRGGEIKDWKIIKEFTFF